ncbi:uncharacterized protein KD926_006307 [Aspergillus affinis]|uniref:uncharacterized protein n=1 Tax=Aspergillus affinis TaxID=1070780 RepID=UPI0022FECE81|nr:uncharacterized protein KD926_006307 [Aspergillus affinis]KAI9041970.1 hypothetical protein KD926_006307 [Aspergillus affinis]
MMNPYLSWALLLVVAGGLGWYYNGPTAIKAKAPIKPVVEKTESALGVKKPKRKTKKSPEPPVPAAKAEEQPAYVPQTEEADKPDEEIDQKEMAKRFAAVRDGTIAQTSTKSQKKKNNKKTATLAQPENGNNERSASRVSTRTSSTTGAEADDDLSPANSPQVNATVPTTGYVSDMLEAPAPGASVLRVTGSMEDTQKKKQKPQSFKQVETKKQRQQRLKNEARKEQVQEAEQERRKLLEKQLHSAREAERQQAAQAKPAAPQTNAWQTKPASNVSNGASKVAPAVAPTAAPKVDLLDTFEPAATKPSGKWDQGLPSEEEQMRILEAGDDQWTTVASKKIKKKGGKADESEASAPESQPTPTPAAAPAPTPVEPKVKVTPTYLPDILLSKQKGHPLDSDWAA